MEGEQEIGQVLIQVPVLVRTQFPCQPGRHVCPSQYRPMTGTTDVDRDETITTIDEIDIVTTENKETTAIGASPTGTFSMAVTGCLIGVDVKRAIAATIATTDDPTDEVCRANVATRKERVGSIERKPRSVAVAEVGAPTIGDGTDIASVNDGGAGKGLTGDVPKNRSENAGVTMRVGHDVMFNFNTAICTRCLHLLGVWPT